MRSMLAGVLAAVCVAFPAVAQRVPDTLRITWRDAVENLDPYYNQQRTGFIVAHHGWDGLVHRDPETFAIKPLLATSWRYTDEATLEFELRRGVTFHDGSPLTADDVAYTINTVIADPRVSVPGNVSWIAGADRLDTHKVRIRLKRVFPAAIEYVAMVLPIWPQATRERMGAEACPRPGWRRPLSGRPRRKRRPPDPGALRRLLRRQPQGPSRHYAHPD